MANNIARLHIGLFGRRNTGKSSVINCLAGQNISIVSDVAGTTTDPVKKVVEIPGLGPVVLIDTAGIDDGGELGNQRVIKTYQAIKQVDLAIIVYCNNQFDEYEKQLVEKLQQFQIPFILLHNKSDKHPANISFAKGLMDCYKIDFLDFSAKTGKNFDVLVPLLQKNVPDSYYRQQPLFGDLLKAGDLVLLITPVDTEAPAGRLILPQVQAIREALDFNCSAVVMKETEVGDFMRRTSIIPALVISDSQLFGKIDKLIAPEIPLTSFSIMLARQKLGSPLPLSAFHPPPKGERLDKTLIQMDTSPNDVCRNIQDRCNETLNQIHKNYFDIFLKSTPHIDKLKDVDRILIMESCTHHSTCDDIGRVKIPRWLQEYTGSKLAFDVVPGLADPPRPINKYAMAFQCGGCMITRKQLFNRIKIAIDAHIPITNYGMAIAYMKGSWKRSVELFFV